MVSVVARRVAATFRQEVDRAVHAGHVPPQRLGEGREAGDPHTSEITVARRACISEGAERPMSAAAMSGTPTPWA